MQEREDGELSEDSNEAKNASSETPTTPTAETSSSKTTPNSLKRKTAPDEDTPNKTGESAVKRQHKSSSKGFMLGVTIPESITPFKSLPNHDKWSVDVSDHMLFENLPDALGTWDKMRSLMTSVRDKMHEIHTEDD